MKCLVRYTIGFLEFAEIITVSDDRVEADVELDHFRETRGAKIREVVSFEGDLSTSTRVQKVLIGGRL